MYLAFFSDSDKAEASCILKKKPQLCVCVCDAYTLLNFS